LLPLLIPHYFVFLLFPYFRFITLFLFFVFWNTFLTITSLPSYRFAIVSRLTCLFTSPFYFILLCLSSYCTYNHLQASVSMFLCILFCSFYSVSSFSEISLCFSLVSSDIAFQFHLLLLSTCSCFFSTFSSFSSVYLPLFSTIAIIVSDQILLLEKLIIIL